MSKGACLDVNRHGKNNETCQLLRRSSPEFTMIFCAVCVDRSGIYKVVSIAIVLPYFSLPLN